MKEPANNVERPCPFCGGGPIEWHYNDDCSWMECTSCRARGPVDENISKPHAAELWDERQPRAFVVGWNDELT